MTEWNDLDPDDDGAQFFRRGGGGPGAPCPSPELVQAARMGTLPPHVQDRVAAHVERCVVCQALGDALNDPSVGELRPDEQARILERVHAGANASTRIRSANRLWQFAGAAAAVVLLIAGTVLVWQSRRAAPAPTTPQVAAKVPRPAAPSVFQLEKPAIRPPDRRRSPVARVGKTRTVRRSRSSVRGLAQERFRGGRRPAAGAGPSSTAKRGGPVLSGRDRVVPPAGS